MDVAVVAEGEVARINCDELILEGRRALPNDAAGFTDGGDVLTNLAFLGEPTVGAELIVASAGVGYLMVQGQSNISTPTVMAGMIAIGLVGLLIDVALRQVEAFVRRRRGLA